MTAAETPVDEIAALVVDERQVLARREAARLAEVECLAAADGS